MKKKITITTITILYIVFITMLSLINMSDTIKPPKEIEHLDKVVHFGFYFIMNFLLLTSGTKYKIKQSLKHQVAITITSISYSIAIEIIQSYVGRSFDVRDMIANSIGALLALLIFRRYYSVITTKLQ